MKFSIKQWAMISLLVSMHALAYAQTASTTDLSDHEPATIPTGLTFEWHIGSDPTSALVTTPSAVAPGIYYGYYKDGTDCYSEPATLSIKTNSCPTQTVDLNTAANTAPAGSTLSFHSALPASDANTIAGSAITQAGPGTYYLSHKTIAGGVSCYSNTSTIVVAMTSCDIDNDGVLDFADLDNDNDGILDINECPIISFTSRKPSFWTITAASDNISNIGLNPQIDDITPNAIDAIANQFSGFGNTISFDADPNFAFINLPIGAVNTGTFYNDPDDDPDAGNIYEEIFYDDTFWAIEGTFDLSGLDKAAYPQFILSGDFYADDEMDIFVNGNLVGEPSNFYYDNPNFFSFSTPTTDLIDGVNTIRIEVTNIANSTTGVAFNFDITFDCNPDEDGDGIVNSLDTDADGDGCPDAIEGGNSILLANVNADGTLDGTVDPTTGVPNNVDANLGQSVGTSEDANGADLFGQCDTDGDGVIDADDICPGHDDALDNDNDGVPDGCDLDDDNDGILDVEEVLGYNPATPVGCNFPNASFRLDSVTTIIGVSGAAPSVGDQYRFRQVMSVDAVPLDAIVTITQADANITWFNIDRDDTGDEHAWQADYFVPAGESATMAFNIEFVVAGTNSVIELERFGGIFYDIDGENANENIQLTNPDFIATDKATALTVSKETNGDVTFQGPVETRSGVVLDTDIAAFFNYYNVNSFSFTTTAKNLKTTDNSNLFSLVFDPCALGNFSNYDYCINKGLDTDGDGTGDQFDNDSDNDGCPDAVEAGLAPSNVDASGQVGGTINSATGIPIFVGGGQPSTSDVTTVGPDLDGDGIADACDDTDDRPDFDGDGIKDLVDLDDDNDGILDSDEGGPTCSDSQTTSMNTSGYTVSTDPDAALGTDLSGQFPLVFDNGSIEFSATFYDGAGDTGTPQWQNGVQVRNDPVTNDYIYVQPIQVGQKSSGDYVEYEFNFPTVLDQFIFTTGGLNFGDYVEITAFNGTTEIPITQSNYSNFTPALNSIDPVSMNNSWTVGANRVIGNVESGGTDVDKNLFTTTILGPITKVRIAAGRGNNNDWTSTIAFHTVSACTPGTLDTDGDGMPDFQDTDADGDGCPDAIEGGGTFTYDNLDNDLELTGGVNGDGIPLAAVPPLLATTGQQSGSSTDENVQAIECGICYPGTPGYSALDSDGDGLTDCEEENNIDDPSTALAPTRITDANNACDPIETSDLTDSDGDGLTDCEETTGVDDPRTVGIAPPNDADGLTSDPNNACDPIELSALTDSDGDGLTDCEETTGIDDPRTVGIVPPNDGDGPTSNPNDACDPLSISDISADADGDGLSDCEESTGVDDPRTTAIQPNGTITDPNDACDPLGPVVPTADCDMDGNQNSTDPHPNTPTAEDDAFPAMAGVPETYNILGNDDFVPGANTTIVDLGSGSATGTVTFDTNTGEMTYTPTDAEKGSTVTIVYRVCNALVPQVCENATATITVPECPDSTDSDNDGLTDCEELTGVDDPSTPIIAVAPTDPNDACDPIASSALTDSDGDGLTDCEETTGLDNPNTVAVPVAPSDPTDACDPLSNSDPLADADGDGLSDCEEASGQDDPRTAAVQPAGTPTDFNDPCDPLGPVVPTADCDMDGNPNGTDPNPTVPTAEDDAFSAMAGIPETYDVLANDDFLPGAITLTDLGSGSATGTVSFDPATGEMTYTPTDAEKGSTVTVVYRVCTTDTPAVCENATATITVPECPDSTDSDNDGLTDCEELTGVDDPSTPIIAVAPTDPNDACDPIASSALTDSDGDGLTDCEETTGLDNPNTVAVPVTPSDPTDACDPLSNTDPLADADGDGLSDCEEASGQDDPRTAAVQPAGTPTDFNDPCDPLGPVVPTADCDMDGNPNGTDPNPTVPTAEDDAFSAMAGIPETYDVLANDDFLPGAITLTDLGSGSATGTVSFDPATGEMTYTPTDAEKGSTVTVVYRVCTTDTPAVCENATATITVPECPDSTDSDNDGLTDCEELTGVDDPSTPIIAVAPTDPNDACDPIASSALTDSDGDGLTDCEETTGLDNPNTVAVPVTPSDPTNACDPLSNTDPLADADGDGLSDCEEASGQDDPRTAAVQPAGIPTDFNDPCDPLGPVVPTADCDMDGNPNGTDPNPTVATAEDDAFTAMAGIPETYDVLANDDFLPGAITLTDLGSGSATGTVSFDPTTGEMTYTPTDAEKGSTVTVVYRVCTTDTPAVCENATATITVPECPDSTDSDNDGLTDCEELTGVDDPSTPIIAVAPTDPNDACDPIASSALTDSDGDGLTDCEETTGLDNPNTVAVPITPSDPTNACDPLSNSDPLADADGDGLSDCEEASGQDDPRTAAVQPAGTPTDFNDPCDPLGPVVPTADCDMDGNPNGTDPNPTTPTTEDDAFSAMAGIPETYDVLANDDFLPGAITLTDLGSGSATGTVSFDPATGEMTYTPTDAEKGSTVTVVYRVCTTDTPAVCENATATITVPECPDSTDSDNDGLTDCEELTGVDDPSTPIIAVAPTDPNDACDPIASSALTDSDGDGLTDCEESTGLDNPNTVAVPVTPSDPTNACDPLSNSDPLADADGDGLSDCEEASGQDDPRTAAVQPAGTPTDFNDPCDPLGPVVPTADCDMDGNPNGTDPNPTVPTAEDDAFSAMAGIPETYDVLANDDFLPGAITLTDLGSGSATGTVSFDPATGEMTYTPTDAEKGSTVTVVYRVCTTDTPAVCENATATITVPECPDSTDSDNDGLTDCEELTGVDDPSTPIVAVAPTDPNDACDPIASSALTDSDGDGLTDCEETTGLDNPNTVAVPVTPSDPTDACDPLSNSDPLADADGDGLSDCEEASGQDDPRTAAVQPAGTPTNFNDPCDPLGPVVPTADCDMDGNPNGTDPNPTVPTAEDDAFTAMAGIPETYDVLANDDFLPGAITLTDLGSGSATGTVSFDPATGEMTYTPTDAEKGSTVTVVYRVCTTDTPAVCENATATITVPACPDATDSDGDGLTDCEELTGVDDPSTPIIAVAPTDPNDACDPIASSALTDSDGDGLTDCEETTGLDNPNTVAVPVTPSDPTDACDPLSNTDPLADADGDGLSDCEEASGQDDPRTASVQPAGTPTDFNDPCDPLGPVVPTADCDMDGNPNGTDPNPTVPTAEDDAFSAMAGIPETYDVLANDDFLPGAITLTDLGSGSATGTVSFDPATGEMTYTPTDAEKGSTVTVVYRVCTTDTPAVCENATATITVPACPDATDSDGDGLTDCEELTGVDDPSTPIIAVAPTDPNDACDPIASSALTDSDGDGLTDCEETTGLDNPNTVAVPVTPSDPTDACDPLSNTDPLADADGDGLSDCEEASGQDDPRTAAVQPAGTPTDFNDPCDPLGPVVPTADCDMDGNPNGTDPNPTVPTAEDDAFSAMAGIPETYDVLANDDFLPGAITLTDLGSGSATGTVSFDPATGEMTYTPTDAEKGSTVTVVYRVCTTDTPAVCENATATITVPECPDSTDSDNDGLTDCEELTGVDDPSTPIIAVAPTDPNDACDPIASSALTDSDGDGLTDCEETTGLDNPNTVAVPVTPSDPTNACDPLSNSDPLADADGDGLSDCEEASGQDDPRTAAVQPAGIPTDFNDPCDPLGPVVPTADCDMDGNPNGTDPNPTVPTAEDDAFTAMAGIPETYDVLANDDFLPGAITLTDLGSGSATGTVSFDPATGEMTYTPTDAEKGSTVTVVYRVCTTDTPAVCENATATITVPECPDSTDSDNDGLTDCEELTGVDDPSTPIVAVAPTDPNDACDPIASSALTDSDGDGLTDCEETTGLDNPNTVAVPVTPSDPTDACDPLSNSDPLADADGDGLSDCEEASGQDDPRTAAVQPAGTPTDFNDPCDPLGPVVPTADCDMDGNPNGTDPNPTVPTAEDDAFTAMAGIPETYDVLANDDFLPGAITLTDLGSGSATGTVSFDPATGEMTYTPTDAEKGSTVTVVYRVCTTDTPAVCENATATITVPECPDSTDSDNDGLTDCEELTGVDDPSTPIIAVAPTDPNDACDPIASSALTDSDGDGLTDCEETTGLDNPNTVAVPVTPSDPTNACDPLSNSDPLADADGDGLSDCEEASGQDDPRTAAVQPAGIPTDFNDPCDPLGPVVPTADCDMDGNPNGTDPNPTVATAVDDVFTAMVGETTTYDILDNDDFMAGLNTSLTDLGTGTAKGSIVFDPTTGTVDYTPLASEVGTSVTVEYQVCNTENTPLVCATALMTIEVPSCPDPTDTDGDGLTDCEEMTGIDDPSTVGIPDGMTDANNSCDPITAPNNSNIDSDGDGLTDCEEITGIDDPDTVKEPILDGDGLTSDPLNPCDPIGASDIVDSDNDGLTDCEEQTGLDDPRTIAVQPFGVISDPNEECDPLGIEVPTADCDGDGVTNAQEIADGTDPEDTCDANPVSQDLSAVSDQWRQADCDGDGVINGTEVDPDGDGTIGPDATSYTNPCSFNPAQVTKTQGGDWNTADCDGDGVANIIEVQDGTDPTDGCDYDETSQDASDVSVAWSALDCDEDGISNGDELAGGSDPRDICDPAAVTVNPTATYVLAPDCTPSDLELNAGMMPAIGDITSIVWSGPNGFSSLAENPTISDVSADNNGSYQVVVTDENGCSAIGTIEVDGIKDAQPIPQITGFGSVCAGERITLSVPLYNNTTNVTYAWNFPGTGANISGLGTHEITINPVLADDEGDYSVVINVDGCVLNSPVYPVVLHDAPSVTATNDGNECIIPNSDLILTSSVTGGSGTYTTEWNGPNGFTSSEVNPMIPNADNASSGVYTVLITDQNGCTATASTTVDVTISPNRPYLRGNGPICEGGQLEITAPAYDGFVVTYNWTGPLGTTASGAYTDGPTIVIDDASTDNTGDYTATVTVDGCTSELSDILTYTVYDAPTVTLTNDGVGCIARGDNVTLVAETAGGSGTFTYGWTGPNGFTSTGATTQIANVDDRSSGNYTVVVTDATGCSVTASTLVDILEKPGRPVITGTSQTCSGSNFTLIAPSYDGNVVFYLWTGPNGMSTINGDFTNGPILNVAVADATYSGEYRVQVSVDGCTSELSFAHVLTVNELPTVIADNTGTDCEFATTDISLLATPNGGAGAGIPTAYEYQWVGPNGFTSTDQNPRLPNASSELSGSYTVVITDANGCSAFATTVVDVTSFPSRPVITANAPACDGGRVTLSVAPAEGIDVAYEWLMPSDISVTGQGTNAITIDPVQMDIHDGSYTVKVTVNGCSITSAPFVMNTLPLPTIDPTYSIIGGCSGSTIQFDANAINAVFYEWRGPNGFISFAPDPLIINADLENNGTYTVVATSVSGCEQIATIAVNEIQSNPETPTIATNGPVCASEDIVLSIQQNYTGSNIVYTWTNGEGNTIGSSTSTLVIPANSPDAVSPYYVNVSINGCDSEASPAASVEVKDDPQFTALSLGDVCEGEDVVLNASSNGGNETIYFWYQGDPDATPAGELISLEKSPRIPNLKSGNYEFYLKVDVNGCQSSNSIKTDVTVEASPETNDDAYEFDYKATIEPLEILANDAPLGGFVEIVEAPQFGTASVNSDGTINYVPSGFYVGEDVLTYSVCSDICPDACSVSTVNIKITSSNTCDDIPNIFTPNGDAMNNEFAIPCLENYTNSTMTIYNRWGDEIFHSTDYQNDWEGTWKGADLPVGTYYYICKVNDPEQTVLKGYVYIQR